jgi:3-carboxy-cis,cis-muconate cycloisomerase
MAIGQVPVLLSAMVQEHERGAGGWQSEWTALPDLFRYTAGAVDRTHCALEGIEVDVERMSRNLEQSDGLLMAESLTIRLAASVGRDEAQRIVREVCRRAQGESMGLEDVAVAESQISRRLSASDIRAALDPAGYLGSSRDFVDRSLAAFEALAAR